jgi:hypothetical protein
MHLKKNLKTSKPQLTAMKLESFSKSVNDDIPIKSEKTEHLHILKSASHEARNVVHEAFTRMAMITGEITR